MSCQAPTVAAAVKSQKDVQGIYAEKGFTPQIFDTLIQIQADSQQALRLFKYLKNLKRAAALFAINGFLSDDREVAIHLYWMVRVCLVRASEATQLYTHDSIKYLQKLSEKVSFEAHRFTGLIRISNTGRWSAIRSIGTRLHDIRRNHALYWDGDSLRLIDIAEDFTKYVRQHGEIPESRLSEKERHYQELGKSFHTAMANTDRKNLGLQRQFMPRRYWK